MAELTKQALKVANNTEFPNNNNGAITPSNLRGFNLDMIDSTVNQAQYTTDSGSWNQQIDALESFSGSTAVSITNLNASSASQQISINNLNAFSASASGLSTGSLLITASAVSNVITFTKGNGSTFNVTVADTTDLTPLNTFTASAAISITNLNASSASQQVSINNLNTTTASLLVETQNLELFSASALVSISNLNASSASQQISINALNVSSASQQVSIDSLNSKTGSYATTGSNIFVGANTFTSISASSFVSASEFIGNGSKITGITASIALPILDEGIPQGNAFSMNFTGSAISAIVVGGIAIVSVNVPDTGSFNSLTASFNSYTASTNADLAAIHQATASLEANSASVNTSITNVNSATASLFTSVNNINSTTASLNTSASLALVTASFDNGTRNLTFTKGDTQTFSVNIPDVSGSTGNFATTGSNVFVGNQTISGSLFVSGSEVLTGTLSASALRVENNTHLDGTLRVTNDAQFDGHILIQGAEPHLKLRDTSGGGFSSGYDVRVNTGSFEIYDDTHNRNVLSDIFNSASAQHTTSLTSEIIVISGSTSVTLIGNVSASIISASTINGLGNPLTFSTSVDSRLTNIESTTASLNTSVTNLNSATASLFTSASLGLVTASFSGNTLTFTKGDATTFGVVIPDVSGSTINTGSFATTGSNNFVGDQIITGSLILSSSNAVELSVIGNSVFTGSTSITGALSITPLNAPNTFPAGGTAQFIIPFLSGSTNVFVRDTDNALFFSPAFNQLGVSSSAANTSITPGSMGLTNSSGNNSTLNTTRVSNRPVAGKLIGISGDPSLASLFGATTTNPAIVLESGSAAGGEYYTPIEFQSSQSFSDGRVTFTRNVAMLENLEVTGSITASLQQGYVWVGDSTGKTTTVATSSFAGGTINTGSFATTGSNNFVGNQTITGSVIISSSAAVDLTVVGTMQVTGSATGAGTTISSTALNFVLPNRTFPTAIQEGLVNINSATTSELIIGVFDEPNFVNDVELNIRVTSGSGIEFKDWDNGDGGFETWLSIAPNVSSNPDVVFKRSVDISGSLDISGSNGFRLIGNQTITGSLILSSSAAIELQVIGNSVFTGSVAGNVVSASITSNTASIDFNLGNYFEITSSVTPLHLNVTNITPGRTSTLIISASASSSILFSPNVAQPSGSAYSGSLGSIDILSLVAFNSSKVNLVATKALI